MRLKLLILFLFTVIFINLPSKTQAACPETHSLIEYKTYASTVVFGSVVNKQSDYYLFLVEKYYKGEGPNALKVTGSEEGVDKSNNINFIEGKKYLLFLKQSQSDILRTSLCSGSKLVTNNLTQQEMDELNKTIETTIRATMPPSPRVEEKKSIDPVIFLIPAALIAGAVFLFLSFKFRKRF